MTTTTNARDVLVAQAKQAQSVVTALREAVGRLCCDGLMSRVTYEAASTALDVAGFGLLTAVERLDRDLVRVPALLNAQDLAEAREAEVRS